ncbi:MAG: DUF6600 domain-containing protein [Candidatus Aminicenantaceae bacterium]
MKKYASFALVFILTLSLSYSENAQYNNYSFARLSYITGNTYIQRAADLGYEEGVVNMPISEGDRIGTTDGRAEIYLGKRNYLRLDNDTKIDFLNLPKRDYDLTRIRIWSGNIYFSVSFLKKEKNIEIHTSDVSIYILERGLYRIDVRENRETEIFVFEGLIEASGEEGSVLIKSEQRLEVANARFTSRPTRFYAVAQDSFDRWSEYRDAQLQKRVAKGYLPEDLEDFEYELATYGDWAYLRPHGYIWVPRGMDPGWRPYYYGRWTWLPLCGWTWLPYEPWGWAPYHFGRWHWSVGLGWYWIPTTLWGPAWVSWYWGYDYFGWAPLSYYGYPGIIINNRYYGHYYGRHYPYNSRTLTVIHKNQLQAKNVSKVALSPDKVKKLGKISLSRKTPPLKSVSSKTKIEKLGSRKLLLKQRPESSVTAPKSLRKNSKKKPGSAGSKVPQTGNVIKGKTKKKDQTKDKKPAGKKVKKKDERSYIRGGSYGYPPSPKISIKNISKKSRTSKSGSFLSRVSKYISGSSSSRHIGKSSSTRRPSSSRAISSRSKSKSSSSTSRGRSSSSRSSKSKSGKVRKKK